MHNHIKYIAFGNDLCVFAKSDITLEKIGKETLVSFVKNK